ncbi:NAD-dependent malic enzyme [Methylophaga frappieri]|uniref:NAD-dependent malic enzyme n=1 Tax=Methylophaga frappieri (strain ATCC BAA-2434 / DSM 25690 / JAM7) TaxID=754477 RepID=I1YL68_METFJ|nr:NAD-dependent malic enzyme [Methylophaga frappieri]AFJ03661.1 NAD-dependent malic enzyme [Methylophaga frappieri]
MSAKSRRPIYLSYSGPQLLATSLLNKGTAFSATERRDFNLDGLLPARFETLEEQAHRAYLQYQSFAEPINRHIYLRMVQDTNETLFYYLLNKHLAEMMPIIYTPTVGDACERFSEIYRRARGLFISYPDRDNLDAILHNATKRHVKVIVVTDGSRILGLGDQGAGGMGIPIGKLSLYTVCGGISPAYTLPILLDVGTDNPELLHDPHYIGWQHPRISDQQYDAFVEKFICALQTRWPDALLQFEDFQQSKALPLLQRYQNRLCCFNDDIQGTAAVTVGTLLSACRIQNQPLSNQRIVFAGAGSAGCGIAAQIIRQMQQEGLSEADAKKRILLIDRQGLLSQAMSNLPDFQLQLAASTDELDQLGLASGADLLTVIQKAQPTVLIGVSGQRGLFSRTIIETMQDNCPQPIIFPLSNPSKQIEATPEEIMQWTQGKALIATGSPFAPVQIAQQNYHIAQCNNSYIFPGIGLAVIIAGIKQITDNLMMTASNVLATAAANQTIDQGLLPPITACQQISRDIALAVAQQAIKDNLAPPQTLAMLEAALEKHFWQPAYRSYRRTSD